MSGTITNWPLTLEQFLSLPEAKSALEMGCGGEITQKVSPTTKHPVIQFELARRINAHAQARLLGRAFIEQRVILSRVAKVPDLTFFRQERLPLDKMGEFMDHPTTAPDFVVEIYSPGEEERGDLVAKAGWYLEQGVKLVLLVDPTQRRITSFSNDGKGVFEGDQALPMADILPGFELTPAELFAALQP